MSDGHPQISLIWVSPTTINVETPEDVPEEAPTDLTNIIDLQGTAHEPEQKMFVDLLSEDPGLIDEDSMDSELTIISGSQSRRL